MLRCREAEFKLVRLFATAGICLLAGFPAAQLRAMTADAAPEDSSRHYFRRYQATAYISLFSVNIFSRTQVGFGYAKADEEIYPQRRNVSLQFLSGSIPARAHGLNRFGFIQENIREREGVCAEADYFGLITANGEESLAQAKAAIGAKSETMPFVAARAEIDSQSARFAIRHMTLSSSYQRADAKDLLREVRASFDRPEAGQPEHHQPLNGTPLKTFLYSVREAMLAGSAKSESRFIYNGKMFLLRIDQQADGKTGQELRAAGLVDQASSIMRMNGAIRNEKTNEVTNFRLWFDRTLPDLLPLRFEFRPKPYLRLVFQSTTGTPQTPEAPSSIETGMN